MGEPGPGELPGPEEKDPETSRLRQQDPQPQHAPLNALTDTEIQKQGEIKVVSDVALTALTEVTLF